MQAHHSSYDSQSQFDAMLTWGECMEWYAINPLRIVVRERVV
jgi:hypothetical protein